MRRKCRWVYLLAALALPPHAAPAAEPPAVVDATTLRGKVVCGYQGWFRCPGDPAGLGWVHWGRDRSRVTPRSLSVEMWPDMTEYPEAERHEVPGFTLPDGRPATLFSSADAGTVDRHFGWMREHGIDGVFVQRFVGELGRPDVATLVLGHARAAANRTGRVFAVEYDLSGASDERGLERMARDWRRLVDEVKLTDDPRYLHHDGKPVVAVFGFFEDRFDATFAHRIIDVFQGDDRYRAALVGGCQWWWRRAKDPEWARAFRRFAAVKPWNVGNTTRRAGQRLAATGYWADDLAEARRAGMLYLPVIYPGFGWDNLTRQPPGTSTIPRLKGAFYWDQFLTARKLGVASAFVAMFDELDEGTAIFKVTDQPPTQAHFLTFEGLPSDFYLRLTGEGTRLLRGERSETAEVPIKP